MRPLLRRSACGNHSLPLGHSIVAATEDFVLHVLHVLLVSYVRGAST